MSLPPNRPWYESSTPHHTQVGEFDVLQEENFYLRTQLEKLLKELHLKEELAATQPHLSGAAAVASSSHNSLQHPKHDSHLNQVQPQCGAGAPASLLWQQDANNNRSSSSHAPTLLTDCSSKVGVCSVGSSRRRHHRLSVEHSEDEHNNNNNNNSRRWSLLLPEPAMRHQQSGRSDDSERRAAAAAAAAVSHNPPDESVLHLENKLSALERKYELQAARHQLLTNELSMLRQSSWHDDTASSPASQQQHTNRAGAPADATAAGRWSHEQDSSPRRRHRQQDALEKGVSFANRHDPSTAGCSRGTPVKQPQQPQPGTASLLTNNRSPDARSLRLTQLANSSDGLLQRARPNRKQLQHWLRSKDAHCRLFMALYQYVPARDSPNDNPDAELALEPGDLLVVNGEMDEDLFYEGETFEGLTGLVPSNYVEQVDDANAVFSSQLVPNHTATAPPQPTANTAVGARCRVPQSPSPPPPPVPQPNTSHHHHHHHLRRERSRDRDDSSRHCTPPPPMPPQQQQQHRGSRERLPQHNTIEQLPSPADERRAGWSRAEHHSFSHSPQHSTSQQPAPPLNLRRTNTSQASLYPSTERERRRPTRSSPGRCSSQRVSSAPLLPHSKHSRNHDYVDDFSLALSMGEPVFSNPGSSSRDAMALSELDARPASHEQPLLIPDSICPFPPIDVTKVSVHEIRQPEGTRVPCPRDLCVEKQLQKSLIISWSPPENSMIAVTQYHVCVDGAVKAVVPGAYKTKALLEDLDLSLVHRLSVRAVTEKGHSSDQSCTITVGSGAPVSPHEVRAGQITPVSVQLTWFPSNSNCEHITLLNGIKVGICPPGVHQVLLKGLSPSTLYRASVRAKDPRAVLEERAIEGFVDFKTLPKIGLPDPPCTVQCEPGPQDGTLLISWHPVTSQPKPPSRAAVAGYLVYADGRKVSEINSPQGDHVLLRLCEFVDDPPLFITVRTRTKEGSISADSNVVRVPRQLTASLRHDQSTASRQPGRRHTDQTTQPPPNNALPPLSNVVSQPIVSMPSLPSHHVPYSQAPSTSLAAPQPPAQPTSTVAYGGGAATAAAHQPQYYQQQALDPVTSLPAVSALPCNAQCNLMFQYSMWPTPQMQQMQPTVSCVPAGQPNQYYVFHPNLSRPPAEAPDKPSLLEMENSYLVKHGGVAGAYMDATTSGSLQRQRALPCIDHTTGMPFRTEQYAPTGAAWSTLSPATRRRLEQYVQGSYSPVPGRRLAHEHAAAKRRQAYRTRSYSADEPVYDDYAVADPYAVQPMLPAIRITGASGSEGRAGSVLDMGANGPEMYDYAYGTLQHRPRRFRSQAHMDGRTYSRAMSEPDLRYEGAGYHPAADPYLARYPRSRSHPRYFIALYDYDPRHMSPNPNAVVEELTFRKGAIIKVYGSKDLDGFYRGELAGRLGLVPGNMVAEVGAEELAMRQAPAPQLDWGMSPRSRRRVEHWPFNANCSDPALASYHRAPGFGDYEAAAAAYPPAAPPAGSAALNPRLRRRLFEKTKSRSLDYATNDASMRRAAMTAGYGARYPARSDYTPSYYDSDRERLDRPPHRAPDPFYATRGSLDRRRDISLPPEDYGRLPGGRVHMDEYYESGEPLPLGDYRRPPIRAMPAYPGAPYDDTVYGGAGARRAWPPPHDPYAGQRDPYAYGGGAPPRGPPLPQPHSSNIVATKTSTAKSFRQGGRDFLEQNIRDAVTTAPAKRMIAKFDYNPRELSPNVDAEQVELNFRAGDVITIYGEMDEDGFYIGELNQQRGLVPSNFLEAYAGAVSLPAPAGAQQQQMPQQQQLPNQQQQQQQQQAMQQQQQPGQMGGNALSQLAQAASQQMQQVPQMPGQQLLQEAGGADSFDRSEGQMLDGQQQGRIVTFAPGIGDTESPPAANGLRQAAARGGPASQGSTGMAGGAKPAAKAAAPGAKPAAGAGAKPGAKPAAGAKPGAQAGAQRKVSAAPAKPGAAAKKKQ